MAGHCLKGVLVDEKYFFIVYCGSICIRDSFYTLAKRARDRYGLYLCLFCNRSPDSGTGEHGAF